MADLQMKNEEITVLHDSKEVYNRSVYFVKTAFVISFINTIISLLQGYYLSALLTFVLCFYYFFVLWLNRQGTRYSKASTILGFVVFLVLMNFAEGLIAGDYLYFLPLLFSIPYMVDKTNAYNREIAIYFIVTFASFCLCIFLCPHQSTWQYIPEHEGRIIFLMNSVCSAILCAAFAYYSIRFERKYAQALLEQSARATEAMKAKSQFLSHMGHELRTPLNGIIGATNLLSRKKIAEDLEEDFNILKYCSAHMLELINNILDFNKIEAGKLELHPVPVNLKQLAENAVLPFHNRFEEKRVALVVEVDQEVDEIVMADDIRLVQILNNLLSNALKFTETGSVKLAVRCVAKTGTTVKACFLVEDTGIGIKEEDRKKVFESFEQIYSESTRRYEGTGLGISICQRLLLIMNSKLQMESVYEKGTSFLFTIDFARREKKTEQSTHTPSMEKLDLGGIKVLLAEDNVINIMIAKKTLQDWNIHLTPAKNGKQALKALEKDASFHLVLLDLEMPEMDGYTAVREIKKKYPEIPVLAFTAALIDNEMYLNLKALGFEEAILKPFQPMDLFSKIRKHAKAPVIQSELS